MTYTGTLDGVRVSVCSTGIGGPSTAIAVEELANIGAKVMIRVGTCGGIGMDVKPGDIVVATSAVRLGGASKEYCPIEYPAAADFEIRSLLNSSARVMANHSGISSHIGTVQCKDAFYGQHRPETLPNSAELLNKWNAWKAMGCLASEMESDTLFIVGAYRKVQAGTVLLCVANQEREKAGIEDRHAHDTDVAIQTAVLAIRAHIVKKNEEK